MESNKIADFIHSNRWVQLVIRVTSAQGRLITAIFLSSACLGMLLADWPTWWTPFPQPIQSALQSATQTYSRGRNFLFDRYQRESPRQVVSQPVTIVAIDEKSLAQMGQWPWPRYKLAELIDAIRQHDPAAIGLDIYMPEADQTSPGELAKRLDHAQPELAKKLRSLPSNDQVLAQSLAQAPSVLGAAGFDFKTYTTSEGLKTWPVVLNGGDTLPAVVRDYPAVLASLPLLQSAAMGQALLSVDASSDGAIRRIPLLAHVNGQPVPALAVEMYRVALGQPSTQVQLGHHGVASVSVGDLHVPTQSNAEVFVHYALSAQTSKRYISALDVMQGRADPDMLSGKLVLIGLTGMGLNDMRITALGEHVPGIEIQAQLMESFFDQQFLLRPWWAVFAEIAGTLLVGGLMIWLIPRVQPSHHLGLIYHLPKAGLLASLAINTLAVGTGFYLFRTHGLMFDASSFFLITSAVFGMLFAFVKATAAKAKSARREQEWHELQERLAQAEAALQKQPPSTGDTP